MKFDKSIGISGCYSRATRRASRRLQGLYEELLKPTGLRQIEYAMLAEIDERGEVPLADFAHDFALDRSSLRYLLQPLTDGGLIVVAKDPRDRRSRSVSLTAEGRTKVADAREVWLKAQDKFKTALGPETAAALREALQAVESPRFVEAFRAA